MGGDRYSTVTPTVTQEVKDKKKKVKNSYSSLTKTVTVGVTVTLPFQPGETQEDPHELVSPVTVMSDEERYLRQIRYVERPDGTFEIDEKAAVCLRGLSHNQSDQLFPGGGEFFDGNRPRRHAVESPMNSSAMDLRFGARISAIGRL